jgi:hypothetical protein
VGEWRPGTGCSANTQCQNIPPDECCNCQHGQGNDCLICQDESENPNLQGSRAFLYITDWVESINCDSGGVICGASPPSAFDLSQSDECGLWTGETPNNGFIEEITVRKICDSQSWEWNGPQPIFDEDATHVTTKYFATIDGVYQEITGDPPLNCPDYGGQTSDISTCENYIRFEPCGTKLMQTVQIFIDKKYVNPDILFCPEP